MELEWGGVTVITDAAAEYAVRVRLVNLRPQVLAVEYLIAGQAAAVEVPGGTTVEYDLPAPIPINAQGEALVPVAVSRGWRK